MSRFWLSYDLGLRGDYQPLYQWLDEKHAEECGDSVATFVTEESREDVAKSLKRIAKSGGRFYLIGRNQKGKFIGGFVAGRRIVPASWAGAAGSGVDAEEEG
jgi:hypothetical protein